MIEQPSKYPVASRISTVLPNATELKRAVPVPAKERAPTTCEPIASIEPRVCVSVLSSLQPSIIRAALAWLASTAPTIALPLITHVASKQEKPASKFIPLKRLILLPAMEAAPTTLEPEASTAPRVTVKVLSNFTPSTRKTALA